MRNEECVEGRAIRIIQVEAAPYVMHPLVLLRSHGGVPLGEVGDGTGLEGSIRIELTWGENHGRLLEEPSICRHADGAEGIFDKPEVLRCRVFPPAQEAFHLEVGVEVTHQDFPKPRWEDRIAPAVAVVVLHGGKFVDDSSTGPIIRRRNDSVDGIHERNSACSSW